MAEQYKVPTLEGLDPKAPDYAAKLDEGLTGVLKLFGEFKGHLKQKAAEEEGYMGSFLREKGIDVHGTETLSVGDEKLMVAMGVAKDRAGRRALEDAVSDYRDEQNGELRDARRTLTQFQRSYEDHIDALLELSEVNPLNEVKPSHRVLHLYVVGATKVYETHIDLESASVVGPNESSNLTSEMFTNPDTLAEFKKQSEDAKGNAYVIHSPSTELPISKLELYGIKKVLDEIYTLRKEAREAEDAQKGPGEKFADSMQRGSDFLGRIRNLGRHGKNDD